MLGPGCHDSTTPGLPDIEYAHERPGVGIGWGFEGESGWSQDGSCTGDTYMVAALVRAADEDAAVRACERLGFRSPDPARLVDRGYAASPFVWDCTNYPWPADG